MVAVRAAHAPLFAAIDAVAYPGADGTPTVVMTAGNWAYRAMLGNLACNMRRVGRHRRYLTVTFDAPTTAFVTEVLGQVAFEVSTNGSAAADVADGLADYNSAGFQRVTRRKLTAVRTALAGGVDVLFTDADVTWCVDAGAAMVEWLGSPAAAAAATADGDGDGLPDYTWHWDDIAVR